MAGMEQSSRLGVLQPAVAGPRGAMEEHGHGAIDAEDVMWTLQTTENSRFHRA